jgi:hypothetical protein
MEATVAALSLEDDLLNLGLIEQLVSPHGVRKREDVFEQEAARR